MNRKRFSALLLALMMLTLTACTDPVTQTDHPAGSNLAVATDAGSASPSNEVDLPTIGVTESDTDVPPSDGSGPSSEQPSQPVTSTEDATQNVVTSIPTDTPSSNTENSNASQGTVSSEEPSGNGGVDSSTNNGESTTEETQNPGSGTTPIVTPDRYGKAWLQKQTNGAQLVKAYEEIVAGVESMKAEITLTARVSTAEISKVWLSYRDDYPEHFWISEKYQYSYITNNKVASVSPSYTMTSTQKTSAQSALETRIADILNGLHGGMSQFDLEKAIHDRLILHTTYVNVDFAHTAYGALVNQQAVCDGYARAFQLLCRRMGIETLIVRGKSNNPSTGTPEGHAWNVVKIDGDYYHIDVTWDDAGEPKADNIHYGWFNVPTSQINKDHLIEEESYGIPTCTATAQNYYRKNNAWLSTLTVDGLVAATKKEGNTFVCKVYVDNPGDLEAWLNENIDELANRYGLNGYQFSVTTAGNEIQYQFKPY